MFWLTRGAWRILHMRMQRDAPRSSGNSKCWGPHFKISRAHSYFRTTFFFFFFFSGNEAQAIGVPVCSRTLITDQKCTARAVFTPRISVKKKWSPNVKTITLKSASFMTSQKQCCTCLRQKKINKRCGDS